MTFVKNVWAEPWRILPLLLGLVLRRPQLQLQMGFDQDEHGIHLPKLCNSFVLAGVRLVSIPGAQGESPCVFLLHIRLCLSKERGRGLLTCCWLVRPKAMLTPHMLAEPSSALAPAKCSWKHKSFHNCWCLYGCARVLLWPGLYISVMGNYLPTHTKNKYNVIFALIWIHEMDFVAFSVVKTSHSCLQINTAILASISSSPTASVNCTLKSLFLS